MDFMSIHLNKMQLNTIIKFAVLTIQTDFVTAQIRDSRYIANI